MNRVVILGCGPAGLAAAKAAVDSGREAIIVSNTEKPSKQYGCQYLHAPIPGYANVPRVCVRYRLVGTPEEYRVKVYGNDWHGKVSPEDFVGDHDAWDIRRTYNEMWNDLIMSAQVGLIVKRVVRGAIPFISTLHPELVISTIPAQALCMNPLHQFISHTIWADGSTSASLGVGENEVLCDGTSETAWYRISTVFGYRTTEWSRQPHRSTQAVPVVKPLRTNCDCHPEVLRAGRYGAWEKKRLVHQVYADVTLALEFPEDEGPEGKWRA